jgi:hypothetical protein
VVWGQSRSADAGRFGEYLSVGAACPGDRAYTRGSARSSTGRQCRAGVDLGDLGPCTLSCGIVSRRKVLVSIQVHGSRKVVGVCEYVIEYTPVDLPTAKGSTFALYQAAQP